MGASGGIDPGGASQTIPSLPTSPGTGAAGSFASLNFFEDFLYDLSSPSGSAEIAGATGMSFGNPAGISAANPGVYYGDLTLGSPGFQIWPTGNTQGFNLGLFATVNIEWLWQLNQTPGGTGYSFVMGADTGNGGPGGTGDLGVHGNIPGGFWPAMPNANLYLVSNNGADQLIDTGVTLASLLGGFHKCNLVWSRATGFVTLLLDSVQIATTNTQIPTTLTNRRPLFAYNSLTSGVINAGTRHLFDYVKITYTMAR